MIELKLESCVKPLDLSIPGIENFKKPIIFYLVNKNDDRPFFVTFVIVDFLKKELLYLFSYSEENINTISNQPDNTRFSMSMHPHCSITINENEDFLTFMEEEEYFFYVNKKNLIMNVYTIDDLVSTNGIKFKKFSSTFYKDDSNPNYFYISIVDSLDLLHIYKVSLTLDNIEEVDSFAFYPNPPHALRKYKDYLLLSSDFKYGKYLMEKTGKYVNAEGLENAIYATAFRMMMSRKGNNNLQDLNIYSLSIEDVKELQRIMDSKYSVKCLPGEILVMDIKTKEKTRYETTGASPAHFEIDTREGAIYTSSHNFFRGKNLMRFLAPAVLDKFVILGDKLKLVSSFSYPKGYRYTSHRVFYFDERPYLCTFAHPNRLLFIDATTMELLFFHDIEEDELSSQSDVCSYINSRVNEFEIVAMEVSNNGENIFFVSPQYIYIYSFPERKLCGKIDFKVWNQKENGDSVTSSEIPHSEKNLNDYKIRTVHLNYL